MLFLDRQTYTWSLWKTQSTCQRFERSEFAEIRAFVSCHTWEHFMWCRLQRKQLLPLLSLFFPCHFVAVLCFPWEYLAIFLFVFSPPLEHSDFAVRVTVPLIVLAASENGVLLAVCGLPAAKCCQWDSGAFRSIDRAIMALFSTLSHPGVVCDSRMEHTSPQIVGYSVRICTLTASVVQLYACLEGGKGACAQGDAILGHLLSHSKTFIGIFRSCC